MFGILARLLEILYSVWPSYGGAIILFTIVIMLVLAPLTFKSTRSMLAMQALQPEVKKLQNRYKDDRQKLNEEMMKFYRENKISPLGGCLPMIIQFPVFIILYQLLYKLTQRGPFGMDLGHSVACQLNGVNACTSTGAYANAGFFDPSYLKHSSQLYQNLSHARVMNFLGIDLSQSAMNAFGQNLAHALPYVLMVLVVMGLTYLQQQQIQSRQPKNSGQNPTQQMMMKFMPVIMGFIYIIIPAGVVVYFLVSSVFRIGQQAMVTRTFYTGPNAISIPTTATEEPEDEEPRPKKSFWEQFKPPADVRPQVGKNKPKAVETTAKERPTKPSGAKSGQSRPKKPSGKKSGQSGSQKSGAKNTAKKSGSGGGQRTSSNSKAGAPSRSGNKRKRPADATSAKKSGGGSRSRDTSRASGGSNGTSKDAKGRAAPSRKAPSRSAPSRKAPGRPDKKE